MTQTLKRTLFGYRASAVREILADRETMFQRAVADTSDAESRLQEVTAELDAARVRASTVRSELAERKHELEVALKRGSELEEELQDVHKRAAELDGEVQASHKRAAELGSELQDVRTRVGELESELARLRELERDQTEQVRRADTEIQGLRDELAALLGIVDERDATITDRDAVVADLRAQIERLEAGDRPSGSSTDATAPMSSPADLDRMLAQTGEQITRMVEDARRTAERQLAETERRRDEIRAEIDRLEAWRDRLVPLARDVRALLSETQTQTADVDGRLRNAIEPMTSAVASLRSRLEDLVDGAADLESGDEPDRTTEQAEQAEQAEASSEESAESARPPAYNPFSNWADLRPGT